MGEKHLKRFVDDISIVLGGEAGQGIQTIEEILARVLCKAGYHASSNSEFMSRIRGGCNSTQIRVSSRRAASFLDRIDVLVALDAGAIPHLSKRISPSTIIVGEKATLASDRPLVDAPFFSIAAEAGNKLFANSVAAGVIVGLLGVDAALLDEHLRRRFSEKGEDVAQKNVLAGRRGHEVGVSIASAEGIVVEIATDPAVRDDIVVNGSEAVALGAIAGGCNFIAAYPMSPSTNVLAFMAQHARELGIVVEQAEDEIAAVNMALGAWYAGARGIASSAGGGFALMCEGVSLAAMIESPLVVHVAQRPAPATGLPTRTEQADLELALYSGHGEFGRAVFAPGTLAEAFFLTRRAFNLADKYQIPVFVLTDQFLMDSRASTAPFDVSRSGVEHAFIETGADYKRYSHTENGLSPRGIPGLGNGLVVVDSDEHDEEGHITESQSVRTAMVDKRLRKMRGVEAEALAPTLAGPADYRTLVVCWGSSVHAVSEAVATLDRKDTAVLHFGQLYPLHSATAGYLRRAHTTVVVEGNATGQFAKLIKLCTGISVEKQIHKYDGMPFSVEEVAGQLAALIP